MTERERAVVYYGVAALTLTFGLIGLASIGFPFLLAGIVLLSIGPVRRRRDVLWPPLAAIAVATLVYVPLVPTTCTVSSADPIERCENVLGFELPGRELTALGISVALAVLVGVGLHRAIARRGSS